MKITFTLLGAVALAFGVRAQNPGYFGKKNVVDASFTAQSPIISNLLASSNDWYAAKNGNLIRKKDYFDAGFRISYVHTFRRNFGLGLEAGYDYFSVQPETNFDRMFPGTDYYDNASVRHEMVDVRSFCIMPKAEFSNRGGLLPMGISHQVGIGIRLNKVAEKDYLSEQDPSWGSGLFQENEFYNYNNKAIRGLILMYAVHMRTPLTKRLFLNYGLRYTFNFMKNRNMVEYTYADADPYWFTRDEMQGLMRRRKQVSFIQANIGLSFAF